MRGVGETGLDFFRTGPEGIAAQEESFRAHIEIAKRHGKALVIHDRDAHADVLRVLADAGAPERTVFHCYSGDAEMAEVCARAGYFMSFAGNVTFKNAQPLRDALAVAPMELVLVETDAPFLTPPRTGGGPTPLPHPRHAPRDGRGQGGRRGHAGRRGLRQHGTRVRLLRPGEPCGDSV